MSRSDNKKNSLFDNNKFVFVFSLLLALICWVAVSLTQTPVTERVFTGVKIQISGTDTLEKSTGLSVYGDGSYTADVTVQGPSYIINASSFTADKISLTASTAAVATAGSYDLPVTAGIPGVSGDIEITDVSVSSIKVYFDEEISKKFNLVEEVVELDGYSLAPGCVRENPILSAETVEIVGPAREINRISSVAARVELSEKLETTAKFEAEIIPMTDSGELNSSNISVETDEAVYITIPVKRNGTYEVSVEFSGVPQAYRGSGIEYTISPSTVDVTVDTAVADLHLGDNNKLNIGTIDFSSLDNTVNYIKITCEDLTEEPVTFTVKVDMSSMDKRWLEIPVDIEQAEIPSNVTVNTESVKSVQLVGPNSSVGTIDNSCAYAVPVLDDVDLTKAGTYTVPAKIVLRTLTDTWVRGAYEMEITVK